MGGKLTAQMVIQLSNEIIVHVHDMYGVQNIKFIIKLITVAINCAKSSFKN